MPPRERRAAATLSAAVLLGYSIVAFSVGSFYPFSVFPMYASSPEETRAARIGARLSDGTLVEVTSFRVLSCDRQVEPDRYAETCGESMRAFSPRYLDDELAHHVRTHQGEVADGEPVDVVRHLWSLEADGSFTESDCVLARCTGVR